MDRRSALKCLSLGTAALSFWPAGALANASGIEHSRRRLVLIVLRGGMDGLQAVPPVGDPDYVKQRGEFAQSIDGAQAARKLDGLFALHPKLTALHELYQADEALILHAAATPYRGRSHFAGQDVMEQGGSRERGFRDGWLNRTLQQPMSRTDASEALAIGAQIPLVLAGAAPTANWSPSRLPEPTDDFVERMGQLYQTADPAMAAILQDAVQFRQRLEMPDSATRQAVTLAGVAADTLAADKGPNIATLELGGWDSHVSAFAENGRLSKSFSALDAVIETLRQRLRAVWLDTAILVTTEFGRTVQPNGTGGTDHGTATCAMLVGGAVRGGRVIADWPGLKTENLYEQRDLRPTADVRSLLKGTVHEHLGVSKSAINRKVFPESTTAPYLTDIIRT